MSENWKDIVGYKGFYRISDTGEVLSYMQTAKGRLLKPYLNSHGYQKVVLRRNNKRKHYLVSILVWDHFGNKKRRKGLTVDHVDNDRTKNNIGNLQLLTYRQNASKNSKKKGKKSSRFIGVTYIKNTGKWLAQIVIEKKHYSLGMFSDELCAAAAYQEVLNRYMKTGVIKFKTPSERGRKIPVGVTASRNKWRSTIWAKGKKVHLGHFDTKEEAMKAYKKAKNIISRGDILDVKTPAKKKKYSKHKYITFRKDLNKWQFVPYIDGKQKPMGVFETEMDAVDAKMSFENNRKLHTKGDFE